MLKGSWEVYIRLIANATLKSRFFGGGRRVHHCRWVSQLLQQSGYSVLEAYSGPDAIKVCAQHAGRIDLLLSDVVMPGGITGDELAAILKRVHPTMRVVLMSGYHQNVFAGEAPWPFLSKPFQSATLIERIKHALAEDH